MIMFNEYPSITFLGFRSFILWSIWPEYSFLVKSLDIAVLNIVAL